MLDGYVAGRFGLSLPVNREELEALRLCRLRDTVRYAAENSRFYAGLFGDRCVNSYGDFAALPFTTAEMLRNEGGRFLCRPPREAERAVSLLTSGTTGNPKRIYFTRDELDLTVEYFMHGMAEFVKPAERILILFPGTTQDGLNDLLCRALLRLDTVPRVFGYPTAERLPELYDAVLRESIGFLVGAPESVLSFSRFSKGKPPVKLNGVLLAASFVSDECAAEIKEKLHCPVFEHYSMTETCYAGCVGCTETASYHIWESDLYYEIINPESGRLLPLGEEGEVVVTTLGRRIMPFIRYRTGDTSRILPEKCPCGSRLLRLERVGSRAYPKKFERPPITDYGGIKDAHL